MASLELYCGEALCKKPLVLPRGFADWPFRCPACSTALYPADVLARTPPNELEPKRAALAVRRGDERRDVSSTELPGAPPSPGPRGPASDADRILAMVDLGELGTSSRSSSAPARSNRVWLALAALVIGASVVIFLLSR